MEDHYRCHYPGYPCHHYWIYCWYSGKKSFGGFRCDCFITFMSKISCLPPKLPDTETLNKAMVEEKFRYAL